MPSSYPSPSEATSVTPGAAAALLARCATPAAVAAIHARLLRCSRAFFCSPYLANCLAAAYSRLGAPSSAILLLRHVPAAKPNVFSHNILLAALVSSGLLEDARRLFDGMPSRDAVSYNSIISGYIAVSRPDDAFQIAYDMRARGVRPTGFTLSIISSAIRSVGHSLQLHGAAIRYELAYHDAVVGNALIDMYRRIGLVQYAVRVFSCMQELDAASWNTLMAVCKDQSHSAGVFECFRSMRSKGLSVDGFTVSTVISACSDMEDFTKGDQILALCLKTSFLSNSIVCSAVISFLCMSDRLSHAVRLFRGMTTTWGSEPCNAMISGYARSGLMEEALNLFVEALRNGVVPTEFTFASVLRWSSCFGLMEQGTQIHCLVSKLGFGNDAIVATALTDMYCKLGLMKHARKIFNAVDSKDLVLWNTMLLGLSQNGRDKEALRMFRRMIKYGIRPDRITLFGALSACSSKGLVTEGLDIISLFKDKYHVIPSLEHHACMVDILSKAGMFREAVNYTEERLQKCGAAAFSEILEACIIQGNVRMAECIAERMLDLKSISSLPYTVLVQIYGSRCKWDKMARVLRLMEDQRAVKAQSCSWLCVKNHVHVFTSDQLLHHGREATYKVLDLLVWDMFGHKHAPSLVESNKSEACLQLFSD